MNIQQFQYVLAVVDEKNFELAAEKCFVSQSTLSTMIGRFESEIGIKIFDRKTKPVSVTAEGEEIISRLRILTHEVDSLKMLVQELKGEMVGELKIGIIPTIAPYLLPLFLTDFASRFPKVRIIAREMTTAQIREGLSKRTLDVGVLATPIGDPELKETDLYSEPFLLYNCTEEKYQAAIAIEELNYSKLCLLQEGHCMRTQVKQICDLSHQLSESDVNFEFESGSMDSLLRLTRSRKGITIIPHLATLDLPAAERKKLIQFKAPVPVRKVGLITNKFFVKKKLLNELQEIIQQSVEGLIPATDNEQVMDPLGGSV